MGWLLFFSFKTERLQAVAQRVDASNLLLHSLDSLSLDCSGSCQRTLGRCHCPVKCATDLGLEGPAAFCHAIVEVIHDPARVGTDQRFEILADLTIQRHQ